MHSRRMVHVMTLLSRLFATSVLVHLSFDLIQHRHSFCHFNGKVLNCHSAELSYCHSRATLLQTSSAAWFSWLLSPTLRFLSETSQTASVAISMLHCRVMQHELRASSSDIHAHWASGEVPFNVIQPSPLMPLPLSLMVNLFSIANALIPRPIAHNSTWDALILPNHMTQAWQVGVTQCYMRCVSLTQPYPQA